MLRGRTYKVSWTSERIKQLRLDHEESQSVFCRRLGVCIDSLRGWEQGRGTPNGSALILLDRIEEEFLSGRVRDPNTHEFEEQPA